MASFLDNRSTGKATGGGALILIHWEFPRLCRGGSGSLTFPGVCPGYPLRVMGFIKRTSTIHRERVYGENLWNFVGQSF